MSYPEWLVLPTALEQVREELWRIKVAADNGAPRKLDAIKRYADAALAALDRYEDRPPGDAA